MSAVLNDKTPITPDQPEAPPRAMPMVLPAAASPAQLVALAVQQGAPIDQLERLMTLQERYEANLAKRAFVEAMNAFKADPPILTKNKFVSFPNSKGGKTEYHHATLDQVSQTIGQALSKHGISHRWEVEQGKEGGQIKVTCVITHAQGHSERVPLEAGPDQSGGKNNIQAVGSTITYLQRYTLLAATGLAVQDQDDDGEKGGKPGLLTEQQYADWEAAIDGLPDRAGADALWEKILNACIEVGDVGASDELRAKLNAKVKSLRK